MVRQRSPKPLIEVRFLAPLPHHKLTLMRGLFYCLKKLGGNMPIKEPDVWALIWSWLQINLSSSSIQSALWALFISILRLGFMRKKPSFRYVFIDAAMCASIAGVAVPICTHIFGHSEYSSFLGTMIGFVGTEKIREFLFKFINRRIEKDDNDDFRSDVQ